MNDAVQTPATAAPEATLPCTSAFDGEMIRHFRFQKGAICLHILWGANLRDGNTRGDLHISVRAAFCSPNDEWSRRRGVTDARANAASELQLVLPLPAVQEGKLPWTKGRIERRIIALLPTLLPLFPQWHRWTHWMQRAGVDLRGEMQQAGMMKWVALAIAGAMGALAK